MKPYDDICPACDGVGYTDSAEKPCPRCAGSGEDPDHPWPVGHTYTPTRTWTCVDLYDGKWGTCNEAQMFYPDGSDRWLFEPEPGTTVRCTSGDDVLLLVSDDIDWWWQNEEHASGVQR